MKISIRLMDYENVELLMEALVHEDMELTVSKLSRDVNVYEVTLKGKNISLEGESK